MEQEETVSLTEATRFGVAEEDDLAHPFDPEVLDWNESWFFDWFDARGERAGHCRMARLPNQLRGFFWLYLFEADRVLAIEAPHLPLERFSEPVGHDSFGLRFQYVPGDSLRTGRIEVSGYARELAGPCAGRVTPVSVRLAYRAVGPAHTIGQSRAPGHRAQGYAASRYEQPIVASVTHTVDGHASRFDARGERDHSWGPRSWNMQWTFLVLHGPGLRAQCAEVQIGAHRLVVGYLGGRETAQVKRADLDLTLDGDQITRYASGEVSIFAEDGRTLRGRIASMKGAEMDISHCFTPPRDSRYRRNLVRFTPHEGGPDVLGWLETNRFVDPAER